MRKKLQKIGDIFSWALLILTSALLIYTLFTVKTAPEGEGAFLFGYRPVFVLTGSMEPYMKTNSVVLTQKVDSIDELQVGDVVTFHVESEEGKTLNITHRIVQIEGGLINTKGDNNSVSDNLGLTMDNVDAKVICVFNQTAWLMQKWETTVGKVMIISFALSIILGYYTIKNVLGLILDKVLDKIDGPVVEGAAAEAVPSEAAAPAALDESSLK